MRLVEVNKLDNGAHRNQAGNFSKVPEGWAVIPEDMELENFPFGEVTAEEINGVLTVTNWVAGEIPEVESLEPPIGTTAEELLNIILGVNE